MNFVENLEQLSKIDKEKLNNSKEYATRKHWSLCKCTLIVCINDFQGKYLYA